VRSQAFLVVGAFALNCLIWSSTWMAIKIGLRQAPPMTTVGVRFAIAAALISAVVALWRLDVPRSRAFVSLSVFLGVCHLAVPYTLVYWGEQHISSGLTAVLYSTMPFVVALMARVILHDPLSLRKLSGIAAGIGGVCIIFSDSIGSGFEARGMAAILVSVFFASLSSVFIKKHSAAYHPIVSLMIPFAVAAVLIGAFAAPIERSNPLRYGGVTWATILYLAVAGSFIAFAVYFWLVKRVDVTVVSYQTFVIPILALLWGWLFMGETVSPRTGLGSTVILVGIAIATQGTHRRVGSGG
jgi:drug/metabolite transporter (DMT)-like permease